MSSLPNGIPRRTRDGVTVTRTFTDFIGSSVFAVAGVAVESGLRMSSGALPGPDLVRAIRLGLEGLSARVACF